MAPSSLLLAPVGNAAVVAVHFESRTLLATVVVTVEPLIELLEKRLRATAPFQRGPFGGGGRGPSGAGGARVGGAPVPGGGERRGRGRHPDAAVDGAVAP